MITKTNLFLAFVPVCAVLPALAGGCSSSSSSGNTTGSVNSGVVAGATDSHCGSKTVTVDANACHGGGGDTDAGMDMGDAGDSDGGMDMGGDDFGATMYNAEGDDDDCKYHVKWSADDVKENANVTFTVTVTAKSGGAAVTQTPIRAEVFLDESTPAPNTNQTSKEGAAGTYTVGPIQFNKPGKWTVRFHFHEDCDDSETSPHGHAAFYVNVP